MQRTSALGPTEHQEMFRMLQRHGVQFTKNSNGVFVNLSHVDDAVIAELQAFVDFCLDNKTSLDEYDKRINACKLSHNYDSLVAPSSSSSEPTSADAATASELPASSNSVDDGMALRHEAVPPEPAEVVAVVPARGVVPEPSMFAPPTDPNASKRAANTKFNLAKKKYARRRVATTTTSSGAAAPTATSATTGRSSASSRAAAAAAAVCDFGNYLEQEAYPVF
jgi:hypothetical protein